MLTSMLAATLLATQSTDQPDPKRLQATVEKLASFQTRNTLSGGLLEAANWVAGEFRKIPGMSVELMRYVAPANRRTPIASEVVQVLAALPSDAAREPGGGLDWLRTAGRIVGMGGHLDSLKLGGDPFTARAPGANDDASGVAATLEAARLMVKRPRRQALLFVAFSGEEQGLLGSAALAKRAKSEGWKIDAFLNNDTVGSSSNKGGQKDDRRVRVFSQEATNHNSRELARYIEWLQRSDDKSKGFCIKLVLRQDRFGRGGDHMSFNTEGFAAVRFVEVYEEYTRQHTVDDLPQYEDWTYLANVTGANMLALSALGNAGTPPTQVVIVRNQSQDTTVDWNGPTDQEYMVYWRDTASTVWQQAVRVPLGQTRLVIPSVNKDDHFFAVGSSTGVPVPAN